MNKFGRRYQPLPNEDNIDNYLKINSRRLNEEIPGILEYNEDENDGSDNDKTKYLHQPTLLRRRSSNKRFMRNIFYAIVIFCIISLIVILVQYNQVILKTFKKLSVGSIYFGHNDFSDDEKYYDYDENNSDDESYNWSLNMTSFGTESCIKLYDIDQDGLDDIIFGLAGTEELSYKPNPSKSNETKSGILLALRGKDGQTLWKIETKSEVFELNCNNIDINMDGKFDCVASGRQRTFLAFNPLNGQVIWDSSWQFPQMRDLWNIYMPLVLPYDFDGDNVSEIVISAGGNPSIPSDVHEREPGFIILISGKTGQKMGNILILPDNRETYMSPVLHLQKDESAYLLIGNGGETVSGHLYIISLRDFFNHVMDKDLLLLKAEVKFKGEYNSQELLENNFEEHESIKFMFSLCDTLTKGVMVPPVLADVNNDGTKDIFIVTFDGTLMMRDGATFEIIWEKYYECYETYTTPAPGYFNEDNILDFMITLNLGTFDYYVNSIVMIINGADGNILWQMETPRMEMVSPLTIQTKETNNDFYFFRVQGLGSSLNGKMKQQVFHGIEPQQPIDKKNKHGKRSDQSAEADLSWEKCDKLINHHQDDGKISRIENEKLEVSKPTCENTNEDYMSTYGLLIDRRIQQSPIMVFQSKPETILYNFTEKLDDQTSKNTSKCIVMEIMERNTGAIGHLTNFNDLDIVSIITYGGLVRDSKGNYVSMLTDMRVFKTSVRKAIKNNLKLKKSIYESTIKSDIGFQITANSSANLRFKKIQTWSSYMGLKSASSV